ncbi:MAG: phosphoribosylformimino-5-aminoimidazole carboxamide ribotide isomerase [Desulfocapsaceae bacterium]|nr:phosphoribosylformimino-5-aminoimidazole carboxamide ribotide isomerase [Desulfocapsaceae bacterium]
MKFRPCIDLHEGKVKQIVGSTLRDGKTELLLTNFVADCSSADYARMYRQDNLTGGHIIKLGPGNDEAAREALQAWPSGMQVGGGITLENAEDWLDNGASHIIVTSCVFRNGKVDLPYLEKLVQKVGRNRLVLDLSCRRKGSEYYIVTERWQNFTTVAISPENLEFFAKHCDEFLIHAADVEGKCSGIEEDLVELLGKYIMLPTTYAGGVRSLNDLHHINSLAKGQLDATVGSALDIFGGSGLKYKDAVTFNLMNDS